MRYWKINKINAQADSDNVVEVTRLINSALAGLDVVRAQVMTRASVRLDAMLGYGPGEISWTAGSWVERIHPDDLQLVMRASAEYLAGRTPRYECEYRFRHKDGRWVWVLSRARVMEYGPDGQPLRLVGTFMDITARKQEQQERLRSELALQATLDTMSQGICMVEPDGRIGVFNQRCVELLELPEGMFHTGAVFSEVMAFQRERGDFGPSLEMVHDHGRAYIAATDERTVSGQSAGLPDGSDFVRGGQFCPRLLISPGSGALPCSAGCRFGAGHSPITR